MPTRGLIAVALFGMGMQSFWLGVGIYFGFVPSALGQLISAGLLMSCVIILTWGGKGSLR